MVKRCGTRWLWSTVVALGMMATAAALGQTAAQQPLLWAPKIKGDSRPIQVTADQATTWNDGQGKRVIVLRGKVWIEQGDAHLRATQAVIWVDEQNQKQTGIYHVDLYSDGGVSLEIGAQTYEAPVSMIELETRGIINLKTFKSKVVQKQAPDDPLFQRAAGAMKQPMPKPAEPSGTPKGKVQQTFRKDVSAAEKMDLLQALPLNPLQPSLLAQDHWLMDSLPPAQTPLIRAQNPLPPTMEQQQPTPPPMPSTTPSSSTLSSPPIVPVAAFVQQPLPGEPVVPPEKAVPQISIRPRSAVPLRINEEKLPGGEKAVVLSPGVIIRIVAPYIPKSTPTPGAPVSLTPVIVEPQVKIVEIAADRVVAWTRGGVQDLMGDAPAPQLQPGQSAQGQPGHDFEFYLAGNVEIRETMEKKVAGKDVSEPITLRCKQAYYHYRPASLSTGEAGRNVAILIEADLQTLQPGLPDPIRVTSPCMRQISETLFEFDTTQTSASKLTYGPGLYLTTGQASLESKHVPKQTIFGNQYFRRDTGEPEYEDQLIFRGRNVVLWLEGLPVFWLPYLQGDARDPLGPLRSISVGYTKVFGFQLMTSWNVFDLIGVDPLPDSSFTVDFDYFSERGPAMASEFISRGKGLFGITGNYSTDIKGMVIHDTGLDILGGNRGQVVVFGSDPPPTTLPVTHPDWRGRLYADFNWQELPYGLTVQSKLGFVSDREFLDQYYNPEWLNGPNQETYLYVKQQENDWAVTGLVEPRIRNWITETEWLPKLEAQWIGQDFLDTFTYTMRSSAGYAHLEPTHQQPLAYEATDVNRGTGRFDLWNELALPLQLGPFRVVPYGVFDGTYYTEDIPGNEDFRVYGGGGVRGSIPFSRLYPDVESELFNLNGIYHKIVMSGNYYWAHSDRSHYLFPQLDRLNDDASDQALRDIRPQQFSINPANATMLNSGFFDPQLLALRKLVDSKVDSLDSIEVVEVDLRQRWQTKRGFPGQQHIIDWMTLDLSASFFPQSGRDNFGQTVNFLEYDWSWNIGDRTTLFSSGWFDPHPGAARVWSFGTQFNRPDSSSLFLGYRQIDPLESKQVTASVNVPFSAKYSIGASTSYDFGTNTQINALTVTRTGTDLMVSLGVTYNSILSSFGLMFEVYPNLFPATKRVPGLGTGVLGH